MTIGKRMKALLHEMEMLGSEYYSKAKDEGDAQLSSLSFQDSSGYSSGKFLFANEADAKAAGALLKPLGYTTAKTAAAPYFSSLDAFKASKFYQEELKAKKTREAVAEVTARAEKLVGKYFRIEKPFLKRPAGAVFELVGRYGGFYISGTTKIPGAGFSGSKDWEVSSVRDDEDVSELAKVLDVLEKGTRVKSPYE